MKKAIAILSLALSAAVLVTTHDVTPQADIPIIQGASVETADIPIAPGKPSEVIIRGAADPNANSVIIRGFLDGEGVIIRGIQTADIPIISANTVAALPDAVPFDEVIIRGVADPNEHSVIIRGIQDNQANVIIRG